MTWQDATRRVLAMCVDTFRTQATYRPAGGSSYALAGIFDEPSVDPQPGSTPMQGRQPSFAVPLASMAAAPAQGDRIDIGSKTYVVTRPEFDGEAGVTLFLDEE